MMRQPLCRYGIVALRDLIVYKVCGVSQNRAGIELDSLRSQPQRPGKVVEAQAEK